MAPMPTTRASLLAQSDAPEEALRGATVRGQGARPALTDLGLDLREE